MCNLCLLLGFFTELLDTEFHPYISEATESRTGNINSYNNYEFVFNTI